MSRVYRRLIRLALPLTVGIAMFYADTSVVRAQTITAGEPNTTTAPTPDEYAALAREMEVNLDRHVLSKWYPAAVDPEGRGFIQNFDEAWRAKDDGVRSVVYQSRLTWLASQAALRYPERREAFAGHARHGLAFLRDVMWDKEHGGIYWAVGADNGPSTYTGGEKHAYGIAFSIYAASAAYEAIGDPTALDLAQRTFRWLDEHAHDATDGGYFEALTREGKPILSPPTRAGAAPSDSIGTRYGLKSMNTHIHLLEAFTALHAVWPDPLVRERLEEAFHVVRDRVVVGEVGCQNLYFTPSWRPIPAEASFGHDVETGFLLVEAAEALGRHHDEETWTIARRLVDHALTFGWDAQHGGFFDHGPTFGPITVRDKVWWVQAEGLNALAVMHAAYGKDTPRYRDALSRQWDFIQRHQVDSTHGGWLAKVSEAGVRVAGAAKSDGWTEGYHQGRALLHASRMLARLAEPASGVTPSSH